MLVADSFEPEDGRRRLGSTDSEGEENANTSKAVNKHRPSRKTMTIVGSIVVVALVLSTVWVWSGIPEPQVTIVAILPLSGTSSYLMEIEKAMALTAEKLNKWGGINGMHIRLVIMDCESTPETAVKRLLEAEEKYHPLAVVTATRGAAIPMAEIAEEEGILLISVGATSEDLTEGKEWVFRYYVAPSEEAETALEILESLNASSVGILHLDDPYGNQVKDELTEAFEARGGTVESYGFARECTEFSDAVANFTDNDAVFAVATRYYYQYIFDDLNSSGYSGHVLGAVGASIPSTWALPEAQGIFVTAPIMYSPSAEVDAEFLAEFEERFGQPLTHQGAIGSDVLNLIWGLLTDNEASRENLRNLMMAGFVHSGILGVLTIEQGIHNANLAIYPAVIEGGELRYL